MTPEPVNGVYLTGWEYNRFLSTNPTEARNSALPASILWNGAHQLWMFEQVYVTKEASANESYATDELGWIMGDVLRFLRDDENALRVVDWSKLDEDLQESLQNKRDDELGRLRKVLMPQSPSELEDVPLEDVAQEVVVRAIREGKAGELERLKHVLLIPLMDRLGCLASGAPTSLEWWMPQVAGESTAAATLEAELLRRVAQPLIPGIPACRSPATMGSAFELQQKVVAEVETPMIVDLIAGQGEFADPTAGYKPYVDALKPYRAKYEEVNNVMRDDWNKNRDHISRLRDAARDHLWPHLHNEWLPLARTGDQEFVREQFPRLLRRALLVEPFASYLDRSAVKVAIGFVTAYGLAAGSHLASRDLGVPPELTEAGAGATATFLAGRYGTYAKQVRDLGIFYQRARGS